MREDPEDLFANEVPRESVDDVVDENFPDETLDGNLNLNVLDENRRGRSISVEGQDTDGFDWTPADEEEAA